MNDVEEWLSEVLDFAQVSLDRDAELRDQVNLMLKRGQTPSLVRQARRLADTSSVLIIALGALSNSDVIETGDSDGT